MIHIISQGLTNYIEVETVLTKQTSNDVKPDATQKRNTWEGIKQTSRPMTQQSTSKVTLKSLPPKKEKNQPKKQKEMGEEI